MKRIFFIIVIFLFTDNLKAQSKNDIDIGHLNSQLIDNKISESEYLDSVNVWWLQEFSSGSLYPNQIDLINKLARFKTIAWKSEKHLDKRIRYYDILAMNARMLYKSGEAIYYFEKLEKEFEKQKGYKPFLTVGEKSTLFMVNEEYDKAKDLFEKEGIMEKLEQYPLLLRNGKIDTSIAFRYIYLSVPNVISYAHLNDSVHLNQLICIANQIGNELKQIFHPKSTKYFQIDYENQKMKYYQAFYINKDKNAAINILIEILDKIKNIDYLPKDWLMIAEQKTLHELLLTYVAIDDFGKIKNTINTIKTYPIIPTDIEIDILIAESKLDINQGLFLDAIDKIKKSNELKEDFNRTLINETQNLYYAHAEAEYNKVELVISERKNAKQQYLIIVVGSILSLLSLIIYFIWKKENIKQGKIIENLKMVTSLQIKEVQADAIKKEQLKIGQDLHDGYSASLAVLIHKLEQLKINPNNESQKAKFENTIQLSKTIYNSIRDKSHYLYNNASIINEGFESNIENIINTAFYNEKVNIDFEIENQVANLLNINQKIEILNIVQEITSNIVKHSKNISELFIFLYVVKNTIILEIGNNGVEKFALISKGIGVKSIKTRIESLSGIYETIQDKISITKITIPI